MEVITIQSEAYKNLMAKLNELCSYIKYETHRRPESKDWLNVSDTCFLLNICKRTLQNYRRLGVLSSTKMEGKVYYSAAAIEEHLKKNHKRKSDPRKRK